MKLILPTRSVVPIFVARPLPSLKLTMPPKGGNPSLSDDDLADIAAYLRTLN